jgi:drug/metabolite transporter (DMT)-like permease
MMTAGGAFYTFNDAAMKMALVDMTYGRAILVRGVMSCALLFLVVVIKWGPKPLAWKNLRGQMECSFYYVLASFLFIYSLPYLSFPVAITALYTSPLFIALLAPWLLKERLNATRVISSLIGFAGVALAARSGDNSSFSWLVLLPIGSALATAMRDITLRRLVRTENSVSILFFQQASLTLFGTAYASLEPSLGTAPGGMPYGIAVAASVGLLLGVYCTIEAFRASDVSAVSALRYASIVWAAFVGAIFWGDRFSIVQIIGMLLVIASGTLIALVERRPKIVTI